MQRLNINEDIKSLSEVRTGIAHCIKQVQQTKRPLVITQRGKSAAVLLDAVEFERMQEQLELLSDMQIALKQLKRGEGIPHEDAVNAIPRLDKTAITVTSLDDEEEEKNYWLSRSPLERLKAVEVNRRMVYGEDNATSRLQRFFEVAEHS